MTKDQNRVALLRPIWAELEKFHIITYFVKECRDAYKSLGVKSAWTRYFAGRAAPMGQVTYETIVATFYNFSPALVREHASSVWEVTGPESFIAKRFEGADTALQRLLGASVNSREMLSLTHLLDDVALRGSMEGKPLYAANCGISVPDESHLKLFHTATLIREHKGDVHNSVLLGTEVSGLQAHILLSSVGHMSRENVLSSRGWSEQQWIENQSVLQSRGLLHEDGQLSDDGLRLRVTIEDKTERLAARLWENLGDEQLLDIQESLNTLTSQLTSTKELPNLTPTYQELIQ